MAIDNVISYGLLGVKEDFADWVSNISPSETPFTSLTGKFPIHNKVFEWQSDRLTNVAPNAWASSTENLPAPILSSTKLHQNYTQILRKYVEVSDTADVVKSYGRGSELEYQIGKATKEMKRDLEAIFLSTQVKDDGASNNTRLMSGFFDLVAGQDEQDPESGAVVHRRLNVDSFTQEDIFDITHALYMVGARANIIMFHPKHAQTFSTFFDKGVNRVKMFESDDTGYSTFVTQITDPLGQDFYLLPNQWMPDSLIYFFHPHDWFQRVLRLPTASPLSKTGSSESWMLEMEVGLQHRNPFASGIIQLVSGTPNYFFELNPVGDIPLDSKVNISYTSLNGRPLTVTYSSDNPSIVDIENDQYVGKGIGTATVTAIAQYANNVIRTDSISISTVMPNYQFTVDSPGQITVGQSVSLVTHSSGGTPTSLDVVSSDISIVKIEPDGKLTGVTPGDTDVTVTAHFPHSVDISVVVKATVIPPNYGFTVDTPPDIEIEQDYTLVTHSVNGTPKSITYASNNVNIVTVDSHGVVTGVGRGTTTITVTATFDYGVVRTAVVQVHTILPNYLFFVDNPGDIGIGETISLSTNSPNGVPTNIIVVSSDVSKISTNKTPSDVWELTGRNLGIAVIHVVAQFPYGVVRSVDLSLRCIVPNYKITVDAPADLPGDYTVKLVTHYDKGIPNSVIATTNHPEFISIDSSDINNITVKGLDLGTAHIHLEAHFPNSEIRVADTNITVVEPDYQFSIAPFTNVIAGTYIPIVPTVDSKHSPAPTIVYSSDDSSVAAVEEIINPDHTLSGKFQINAVYPGDTTIIATAAFNFGVTKMVTQPIHVAAPAYTFTVDDIPNVVMGSTYKLSTHITTGLPPTNITVVAADPTVIEYKNNVLNPLKEGNTTLTITAHFPYGINIPVTKTVQVVPDYQVAVEDIPSLIVGTEFDPTINYTNGRATSFVVTTTDHTIATPLTKGVKAISKGTTKAQFEFTYPYGIVKTVEKDVTVIDPIHFELVNPGQLKVGTVEYINVISDASPTSIAVSSSDTSVATVVYSGGQIRVTTISEGDTVITAVASFRNYPRTEADTTILSVYGIHQIEVNIPDTIVDGETLPYTINTPDDPNANIKVTSQDPQTVDVDESAKTITGKKVGSTDLDIVITFTDGFVLNLTEEVTVTAAP